MERRTDNEIITFEDAVHTQFGDEIALVVGDVPGQLTRRLLSMFQRNRHHFFADLLGDLVPELLVFRVNVG